MRRTIKKRRQRRTGAGAVGTCHRASCARSRVRDVARVRGSVQPCAACNPALGGACLFLGGFAASATILCI